jgi:hypothetical protein
VIAHERVLDAIAARNADKARDLMEELLSEVMDLINAAKAADGASLNKTLGNKASLSLIRGSERKKAAAKARR